MFLFNDDLYIIKFNVISLWEIHSRKKINYSIYVISKTENYWKVLFYRCQRDLVFLYQVILENNLSEVI
jgi:hypothetical protein